MSKNTIEHFIWGFQQHFCGNAEYCAGQLFRSLDQRFSPKVFLVGILEDEQKGQHKACIEPEDDFWAKSERFEGLENTIEENIKANPESQLFHSHPRMQELGKERLHAQAIKSAIETTISEIEERPTDQTFFVSFPRRKAGYLVSTVLSLQTSLIAEYPSLLKSSVPIHEYRDASVATSLIDACVAEFLDLTQAKLELPRAGEGYDPINTKFALADAASFFMKGISARMGNEFGSRDLFRIFNTISSLRYEKAVGAGSYVIANKDHVAVDERLRFSSNQSLDSGRASRKLLELASKQMPLHTDSSEIFGLCTVEGYAAEKEDLFYVNVTGHQEWELRHADVCLMTVKYGQPALPGLGLDTEKLRIDLARLFPSTNADQIHDLIALVQQAQTEAHGTMLLISEAAESESVRLSTQATPVVPTKLTPNLLAQLTTIDGAVILSPDGTCFAIGAILDGLASEEGDPARGARYNSAVRYVKSSQADCLAVVVSEDGGTTFLPDLPAPIKREDIDNHLKTLNEINSEATFSKLRFNESRNWIEEHVFYLLQEDCELLNDLLPKLNEFHYHGSALKVSSSHVYKQHPAMDPKYYYLESMQIQPIGKKAKSQLRTVIDD